jgi:hypothetical protein
MGRKSPATVERRNSGWSHFRPCMVGEQRSTGGTR